MKLNFNCIDEVILEQVKNDMNQENYQKETNENDNQMYFNNFPNFGNNERINLNENEENELGKTLRLINQLIDSRKKKN
jgi:hypothetical protein